MTISGKDTVGVALACATKFLSENKSISTPRLDCEMLLCFLLRWERIDLILRKDTALDKAISESFSKLVRRRFDNEPISYIIGKKEFMSLDFFVEPGVLIPRPETELLVEYIIEKLQHEASPAVLDLCTGSGAIAVSVAHYLKHAKVTAIDKFDVCVHAARRNAAALGLAQRVEAIKWDIFQNLPGEERYQCMVSNPPYIQRQVLPSLPKDVKDYEPDYALNGGDDGLVFYRRILEIAKEKLMPKGILVLEIGYDQGKAVSDILDKSREFCDIQVRKDFAGLDRMVTAARRDKTWEERHQ